MCTQKPVQTQIRVYYNKKFCRSIEHVTLTFGVPNELIPDRLNIVKPILSGCKPY